MDESIINYAKKLSMDDIRKDPRYKFDFIKIPVKTICNNGVVTLNGEKITQKCFFISLAQGINSYGTNLRPDQLITFSQFTDLYNIVDTQIQSHRKCIEYISKEFDICINIYIGKYDDKSNSWYTTPDPSETFGNTRSYIQVHILNMGFHFENIISNNEIFIHAPRMMIEGKAESIQEEQFKFYETLY